VGTIGAAHGVRGEVRVYPETDVTGRFSPGAVLECQDIGSLEIASVRGTAKQLVVRFKGYQNRASVWPLRGKLLRVSVEEARKANAGAYLWADLVGMQVRSPEDVVLGTVREMLRAGGADVLVVRGGERELLLPMISTVVLRVDLEASLIVAAPQEEA